MKRNLQHIDEIRFLVIHIILINHWALNLFIFKTPCDFSLVGWWIELTSPVLALISGYLFFYKTKESFSYTRKLRTRFHSLVIPYLFWTISFYLIYVVIKQEYARIFHQTIWYEPVQALSFKNLLSNIINPPLVNFWYLQNLVIILPFNFLIYYLLKNRYVFLVFFILIICVYAFNLFNIYLQPRFLPFYLMGCYFGYHESDLPKLKINLPASLLLIPLLGFVCGYTSNLEYNSIPNMLIKIAIVLLFSFCVFNMLDSNQNSWVFRYLQKYKAYSFFLFAINMFIFSIVQRTLLKLGAARFLGDKFFTLGFLILSYVLVILIAFTMAGFLKRKTPRFFGLITGR